MRLLAFIAVLIALAGCDDKAKSSQQPAASKAVLLVTWLVPGQPPATTQTSFTSMEACDVAEAVTQQAGQRAREERERLNQTQKAEAIADGTKLEAETRIKYPGFIGSGPTPENERKLRGVDLPQVSAYCVQQ